MGPGFESPPGHQKKSGLQSKPLFFLRKFAVLTCPVGESKSRGNPASSSSMQGKSEQVRIACSDLFYKPERNRTAALPFRTANQRSVCGLVKRGFGLGDLFCIA